MLHFARLPFVATALLLGVTAPAIADEHTPPPPVAIDGADEMLFATLDGDLPDGRFSVERWYHWSGYDNGTYLIGQARLTITLDRPSGAARDLEGFEFGMAAPWSEDDACEIRRIEPQANAAGVSVSGSLSLSRSPSVSIGTSVVVGSESAEIERAGPGSMGLRDDFVVWTVDFDDFSDLAEAPTSWSQTFLAMWFCPDGLPGRLSVDLDTGLMVETDETGFNRVFSFGDGSYWELDGSDSVALPFSAYDSRRGRFRNTVYADRVVRLERGTLNGEPPPGGVDPAAALHAPDGTAVTLGCGGVLTLEFIDNYLFDVEGPDLVIHEVGASAEHVRVEISRYGREWVDVGIAGGGRWEIEIGDLVQARFPGIELEELLFRHVRLTDLRSDCGSRWPGADIDAVAAVTY